MTDSDSFTFFLGALEQLAAHGEQITRHGRMLQEHAAALTELAGTTSDGGGPDGFHPEPAPEWWKLPAAGRAEPIAQLRAWVMNRATIEQVYQGVDDAIRLIYEFCPEP